MFTKKHESLDNAHTSAVKKQTKRHMKMQGSPAKAGGHKGHVVA